jgi:hypothetical protein
MLHFDVERNEQLIKIIFQRDVEFWNQVLSGIVPEDDSVAVEMPEIQTGEVIDMSKVHPNEWQNIIQEYRIAKQLIDDGEAALEMSEERIKALMALHNASVAEGAGSRVYWKDQAGKKTLDKKTFLKENPLAYEIYESFLRAGKPTKPFRVYFPKSSFIE